MRSRKSAASADGPAFNHAMIYVREMEPALRFYGEMLGFGIVETYEHRGRVVYARLRAPRGDGTIALHMAEPGRELPPSDGVRLYFEIRELEKFCRKLQAAGLAVDPPKVMPWGWKHVYLNDPAGHEVSLYWAGAKRYRKSRMTTEKRA